MYTFPSKFGIFIHLVDFCLFAYTFTLPGTCCPVQLCRLGRSWVDLRKGRILERNNILVKEYQINLNEYDTVFVTSRRPSRYRVSNSYS